MACYSGTGNIPQIISDTTGCIVYAPLGNVNSSSALTESNPLNARVYDKNGGVDYLRINHLKIYSKITNYSVDDIRHLPIKPLIFDA